jgi:hypothetical protein
MLARIAPARVLVPRRGARGPFASLARSLAVVGPSLSATVLVASLLSSCNDDDDDLIIIERGKVIAAFSSIADYLDDATVQFIFRSMPRHTGNTPPDVSGTYEANGTIIANSVPGSVVGGEFTNFDFCAGSPVGASLIARVLDASIAEVGASFIEGSGDSFTIFASFRSQQDVTGGDICEIHQILLISGTREVDGSLSELFIGQGVVGLVGDCFDLFVGDFQIAETTALRTGNGCANLPDGGDPNSVELSIENLLLDPIVVFITHPTAAEPPPFIVFPLVEEDPRPVFVPPGFTLAFETLQPSKADTTGLQILIGELITGDFAVDDTGAGGRITYVIENEIGADVFYAPRPVNTFAEPIYAIINSGIDYGVDTVTTGTGLGCKCPLEPGADVEHGIGYYSHSVAGFITPAQANARFFSIANDAEVVPSFDGPFNLEVGSGAVVLEVGPLFP